MDFSFSEEQEAVRELADRIFTDLSTQERLREMEPEADGDRFDRKLWSELAAAGLLGIALPEGVGGAGLGFLETGLLAEAAGRTAAYVPVVETLAAAAPAIARFGTEAQQQRWLPGGRGRGHRTDHRPGGAGRHARRPPSPWPSASGDGWTLTGVKACVPSGTVRRRRAGAGPHRARRRGRVPRRDAAPTASPSSARRPTTASPRAWSPSPASRSGSDALLGSVVRRPRDRRLAGPAQHHGPGPGAGRCRRRLGRPPRRVHQDP